MALIVIFAIMGLVMYKQSLRIAEDQIRQKNDFLLREVQSSMSSFIDDSNKLFSHLIYLSSSINPPAGADFLTDRELSYWLHNLEMLKSMPPVDLYQDFILDYYILLKYPQVILNNEMSLPLESYLKYSLDLDGGSIRRMEDYFFGHNYEADYFTDILSLRKKTERPGMNYQKGMIRKIGSAYSGLNGLVVIYINTENFYRELRKIDISRGGGVFTLDRKGNIEFGLACGNYFEGIIKEETLPEAQIDLLREDPRWFITESNEPGHPFRYISVQSTDFLRDQTRGIRIFLLTLIAALLLIGLLFSLAIVYFNSKPLNEIFKEFQKKNFHDRKGDRKIRLPGGLFSGLNFQVQNLSRYLEQQREHLESNIIERLLNGYHISQVDYRNVIEKSIDTQAEFYTVLLLSVRSISAGYTVKEINEEGLWKSQIKVLSQTQLREEGIYIFDRNPGEVALIHQSNGGKCQSVGDYAESIFRQITSNDIAETIIAIGGSVADIDRISLSYEEAIRARDALMPNEVSRVIRFAQKAEVPFLLNMPVDLERKLTNSLISGDTMTLDRIFDEIYDKNFHRSDNSFKLIRILIDSLINILLGVLQRIPLENKSLEKTLNDILKEDITIGNYKAHFRRLQCLMTGIAEYRVSTQNERKSKMINQLCRYIDGNFRNPLLSADMAGDALGISGNYVYKLFKENYGTSFHKYLEKKRMDNAMNLLEKEKGISIKEIAHASGYKSLNTFYKAFRKCSSMSAGDYRKLNSGP